MSLIFAGPIANRRDRSWALANLDFSPSSASDIAFFSGLNDIGIGDYYYLNFNVGSNGSVYPNKFTLNIYDSLGKLVYSNQTFNNINKVKLDDFNSGIYFFT